MKSCSITFGLLLLAGVAAAQWTPHADAILTNGSVVSVDDDFSIYEAVAIKDGRIIALGATDAVLTHRGDDTHVSDLEGRVVIPGLQDSHIHFLGLGHDVAYEVELSYAESAAEIVDAVRRVKKRRRLAPGEWLTGRRWDQYKYPEMVTRWQLDAVTPDNPVAIYRVYRGVAANTETFRLMGIVDTEPETWPAWWLEDPEDFTFEDKIYRAERSLVIDGREETREVPTGVFLGSKGSRLVTKRPPPLSFDDDVESVRLGVQEMLRLGVTSIIDPSSRMGHNVQVYQEAKNRGYLDLRIGAVYEGTFNRHSPAEIRAHLDRLKINNIGDRFLRWRVGTRSAWVSEPFAMWEELEGERNFGYPVLCQNSAQPASTKELRLSKSGETLAHEQVTRRPPTLDCGSTHRWIGCVSFIIIASRHPGRQRGTVRRRGLLVRLHRCPAVIRPRALRDRRGGHGLYAVGLRMPELVYWMTRRE